MTSQGDTYVLGSHVHEPPEIEMQVINPDGTAEAVESMGFPVPKVEQPKVNIDGLPAEMFDAASIEQREEPQQPQIPLELPKKVEPAQAAERRKVRVHWHTTIGVVVAYYYRVHVQSDLVVLMLENNDESSMTFIPRPLEEGFWTMEIRSSREVTSLKVRPVGVQFTIDDYDFVVMLRIADD